MAEEVKAAEPEVKEEPKMPRADRVVALKRLENLIHEKQVKDHFDRLIDTEEFLEIEFQPTDPKFVRNWYGRIPSIKSKQFSRFLISSKELVKIITGKRDIGLFLIEKEDTAYADMKERVISISRSAFVRGFYEEAELTKSYKEHVVAVANGLICHEAAHFAKTPGTIPDVLSLSADAVAEFGGYDFPSLLRFIMNVVEDVYIEDWLRNTFPFYEEFIYSAQCLYFSKKEIAARLIDCLQEGGVYNKYPANDFFNLWIAAKRWDLVDEEFWGTNMQEYVHDLGMARGMDSPEDRANLAFRIYKHFINDEDLDGIEELDTEMKVLVEFDENGLTISVDGEIVMEIDKEMMIEIDKASRELLTSIDDELHDEKVERKIGETRIERIPPPRVIEVNMADEEFDPDERFLGLGKRLRQAHTTNNAPAAPMKRGPKIVDTRLPRIVTDGKIFTIPQPRKKSGKQFEFTILVDCSGSMHGEKVKKAMAAGLGAFLSLRQMRARVTLLGHTTEGRGDSERTIILPFGMPHDSSKDVAARCYTGAYDFPLRDNLDGFAIRKSAEIGFSGLSGKRRWLFVISDGAPAGNLYYGDEADEHTRLSVKAVRRQRISVISITIDGGAYEVNDFIYGEKSNVKATSPTILNDLIRSMFLARS